MTASVCFESELILLFFREPSTGSNDGPSYSFHQSSKFEPDRALFEPRIVGAFPLEKRVDMFLRFSVRPFQLPFS